VVVVVVGLVVGSMSQGQVDQQIDARHIALSDQTIHPRTNLELVLLLLLLLLVAAAAAVEGCGPAA
jgi:hypothetical protein